MCCIPRFASNRQTASKLQVNHKNGESHLCADAADLEWLSAKETCQHTNDTALTTIQRAVDMRDSNTNQALKM